MSLTNTDIQLKRSKNTLTELKDIDLNFAEPLFVDNTEIADDQGHLAKPCKAYLVMGRKQQTDDETVTVEKSPVFKALRFLFSHFFFSTLLCFDHGVSHLGNDQFYGTDRVVIARDHIIKFFRITVCITDTNQSDAKLMSFLYADSFLLGIDDEDCCRDLLHVFDTIQVLLQFLKLLLQSDEVLRRA